MRSLREPTFKYCDLEENSLEPERSEMSDCVFCKIINGEAETAIVFEDDQTLGFLDHRPLFPGHVLLIPKQHFETLADLPAELLPAFFQKVQLLSRVVENAMNAEGTFVAMNNRVSQSVPHLHVHIVPRRRKDGLKGFFWPRTKYVDEKHLEETKNFLCVEIDRLNKNDF